MIPGWLFDDEAVSLVRNAKGKPGPWVEIGTYCGLSASHIGAQAALDGVVLFAVDPHQGNPEMAPGNDCHHPEVWARENGSLSVLLDTVADLPVVPVVGTGEQFALTGVRPGFVFIDGSHDYHDVRQDFRTWSALLVDGGVIALHDSSNPTWGPGVVLGEALAEGWTLVEQVDSLAVLSR